jgi:hypothetical protein
MIKSTLVVTSLIIDLKTDYLEFTASFKKLPGKGRVATNERISLGINILRLNLRLK